MNIAIIGAGISGIAMAKELSKNNINIDIFEKSRGRGGRTGTKRVDNLNFDLGAQYLNNFDDEFQTVIEDMKKNNVVDIWNGKLLSKYRKKLLNGDRSLNPCNKCNADGTVYGEKHYFAWKNTK